jgi:hypothetical protein
MTTNIQSFAGDVQIDSGNLSVKSLEVKDGVTKLGSNNTTYSNVGVMMTRKDGASNVAFLFTEDGANVVLGYTNDDALEGDRIDILSDETANLVVYGNVYVSGSVHGDGSTLTGLVTTLQSVSEFGSETDQTILFTNEITGINVSSNVLVSGNVTANVYYGDGGLLSNITQTLEGITAIGNTTTYTLEFNNTHTSFVTVSNVGIGNALPTADLCVGANVVIDDASLDKISVTGNVNCHQLNLGSIEILPAYSLENVTQIANTTTNTISFNHSTLAFDTQKMAGIGIIPSSADVGVSGLHVDGHLRLGGQADNTDNELMYIKSAGALGVLANESDTNNTNTDLRLQSGETYNSNITMVGKSSAQYMTFGTNTAERMRIDSSGRIGIGTGSPQLKMDVYTDDTSGTQLFLRNDNTGGRGGLSIAGANGQGFYIQKIGIDSSNVAILENYSTTDSGIHFYTKGDGDYRFRTTDSNSTRFLITNDGDVAVGDITPQSKLHVDGDVRMKTLSTNVIGKITPVYARGTGNNNGANRLVKIGDTTHVNTGLRGLTLTIINASTHAHVSSTNYDTYGSTTASDNLATALEAMTDAQIGILTSYDAYEDDITANLITAALKLGLTRLAASVDDNNRHPYAAIFYGPGASGVPGNHALEVMKSDDASGAYATLSTFLIDDSFIGQTLTNALYSGTADATTPTVIVDRNENVGIGKMSPSHKLHVDGDIVTDQGHDMNITRNDTTGGPSFGILNTDGSYSGWFGYGSSTKNELRMVSNDNYPLTFWTSSSGDGVEKMRIAPDGNVGIGTTNPSSNLHVNGSVYVSSNLEVGTANLFVDTTTGNVGIGTNSAEALLHIVDSTAIGSSSEVLRLQRGIAGVGDITSASRGTIGMYLEDNNAGGGEVARISWAHDGGDSTSEGLGELGFWTSQTGGDADGVPVERMTIRANGNVGIGTTNPTSNLHVKGNVYVSSNLEVGTANLFVDTQTGNVGIGTTSPQGLLHISSGTSGDAHLILEADTDNNNESDNPKIVFRQDGGYYTGEIGLTNNHMVFRSKSTTTGNTGFIFYSNVAPGQTSNTDIDDLEDTQVEVMRITGDGNVGIGTASPDTKFGVYDQTRFDVDVSDATYLKVGNRYSSTDQLTLISAGDVAICSDWNANQTGKNIDFRTNTDADGGTLLMRIQDDGKVGIGTASPGYMLDVNGQIFSRPSLAPAASTYLYDLDDDDAKILFYKNSYENWAGMGCDTGGSVWIKAGTEGQGGSVSLNSAGRFAIGKQNAQALLEVNNIRETPTLYQTFNTGTGIGGGSTLTLPGNVTYGTEKYTINPNWKKSSVCIITYDNANSTSSGLVYIFCQATTAQPAYYLQNSSTGSSQIVVDVGESRACHIKPVSGVTIRVTKCEWIGDDSRVIIKGHTPDITTDDPSNNNYAQLEIQSAAAVLGTSTTNPVNLQLGAYHGGGGNVGCGFIQGICNFIYASPVCLQPRNGNVGIGTINPSYGSVDVWTGQRMSLLYDAFKNGTSTLQAGYSIDFRYGGNTGERGNIVARLQSYSWMNSSYVMRGGFGIEYGSGNGTTYTGFIINDVGDVGIGIGASTPYGRLEVADDDFYQLVLRNTSNVHYWRLGVENSASNTLIVYPANKSGGSSGGVFIRDGNTAWSGNSDERLKENIGIISNCLDKIKDVRPVTFNWKNTATPSQKQIGFIAQDWKDVVPEVVSTHATEDLEDCLTMQMVGTIPVVCGAVQELNAKVDEHIENKNLHVSDRRIKTNIVDVEDASALDSFRLLQPKRYEYVDKDKNGTDVVWGFLAQEVKEAVPYATTTKTGYLPNIQQYSNISGNVMTFTNFSTSNLESNALVLQVRDILGKFHDVHITEIIDETSVRIGDDLSLFTGSYDENGNVVTQTQTKTITTSEYNQLHNTFGYAPKEIVSYTSNVVVSYSSNTAVYYEPEQDKYYTEIEYSSLMTDIKSNVIVTYDITTITSDEYKLLGVEERAPYVNENWQERIIDLDEYDTLTDTQRNEMNLVPNIDYYVKTYTTYPGDLLYVYGQRVDDFVYLKKDAIWTLTTAALQEVDRQLQAEKAKVEDLLKRVEALESS